MLKEAGWSASDFRLRDLAGVPLVRLFEELRGLGYVGGYDAVRRHATGIAVEEFDVRLKEGEMTDAPRRRNDPVRHNG
jgi:hypothetical protein